jgi:hypothetical protein
LAIHLRFFLESLPEAPCAAIPAIMSPFDSANVAKPNSTAVNVFIGSDASEIGEFSGALLEFAPLLADVGSRSRFVQKDLREHK